MFFNFNLFFFFFFLFTISGGGNDAGKEQEIIQLKQTNSALEVQKQQESQRANQAVYQLEQMKVSVVALGEEKERAESGLILSRHRLTKSTGALQQIAERFEHLKQQNVKLQEKLRQVKTLSLMDKAPGSVGGGGSNRFESQSLTTFPNTPSA